MLAEFLPAPYKQRDTAKWEYNSLLLSLEVYHPPLRKHQPGQESDGQTGSWCLDKVVQPRDAWYQKKICPKNLPIPHPQHNSRNRALEHPPCAGKFQQVLEVLTAHQGHQELGNCACQG